MAFQQERVDPHDVALRGTDGQLIDDDSADFLAEALSENSRVKKVIQEFMPFIEKVKELIVVLCATDSTQPFWNLPIDTIIVKLHHFCIVNSELLELMYNNPNFDREVTKNIETIQAVHNSIISHKLENQQSVSFLLIELHQALQILDLD